MDTMIGRRPLLERTLSRQRKTLGTDNRHTQRSVGNLGYFYRESGQLDKAIQLLTEAVQFSEEYPSQYWVVPELLRAYLAAGMDHRI